MRFLLDTDTCSAHLKNNQAVSRKVMLHYGALAVSTITVAEFSTWGLRRKAPPDRARFVEDFLKGVVILDVDIPVAMKCAEIRAHCFDQNLAVPDSDLYIAATALLNQLTLVTHNTQDFINVPGLQLEDWFL